MARVQQKSTALRLSVEEQNLAAIPFAVLERRLGRKVGSLQINGTKMLPNGQEVRVQWQVQGNTELGLPTEQDLDIFVALGVLTFQRNFEKTVSFSGRELARILNISGVHGKFYRRLKLAMDRFIPLRFRAIASTDRQEEVKWLNVFQEASFTLDRESGRCTGTVTWTDRLIQSMDSGFFRLLDAGRYMELDGLTAKHLYRFLAVAFERSDMILIDARQLAAEHLGIVNPPKYFSRLLQTLEPAFEQLISIQVMGAYHVVSSDEWKLALHRHGAYTPENQAFIQSATAVPSMRRANCAKALERAGIDADAAGEYSERAEDVLEFYGLDRAAQILEALRDEGLAPHVAMTLIRKALDAGVLSEEGEEALDHCEIAVEICREKKRSGQTFRNAPGFIAKLIKDPEARARVLSADKERAWKERFRKRAQAIAAQERETEMRNSVVEYECFRSELASNLFRDLTDDRKNALRKAKAADVRASSRLDRLSPAGREQELDNLIIEDIAKNEAPPFERWYLRKRTQQAVLPFETLREA